MQDKRYADTAADRFDESDIESRILSAFQHTVNIANCRRKQINTGRHYELFGIFRCRFYAILSLYRRMGWGFFKLWDASLYHLPYGHTADI